MKLTEAKTDWLGSRNYFYNIRTNEISTNINDIIYAEDVEFHPEGVANYLDFGYSVFGQTPLKNIKVLLPNQYISNESGKLVLTDLEDSIDDKLGKRSTVTDTLDYMEYIINEEVKRYNSEIIVPTSGGFDSRMINSMIHDHERIRAYTYGISDNQRDSLEVVYAKRLCEILNIEWKQIELNPYICRQDEWYSIYGVATHTHGMYQMEFYSNIKLSGQKDGLLVSGIYGDLWAGNWNFSDISKSSDLISLAITHGCNADGNKCMLKHNNELKDAYFEKNRDKLKSSEWRIITAARLKVILLSYLLRIPEYYGYDVWSPFLDADMVAKMVNLDSTERERRKWQVNYFDDKKILIGSMNLACDKENRLEINAAKQHNFAPLDARLLGSIVDKEYIDYINRLVVEKGDKLLEGTLAYYTLYPLQKLLLDFK